MSDQFLAEIRAFPFAFAPKDWALCNGQSLNVPQYTTLFSLLGNAFGGDGVKTFNLPALQNSVALGVGQGPGLSEYLRGQKGGQASVPLEQSHNPTHNHKVGMIEGVNGNSSDPSNGVYAKGNYYIDPTTSGAINAYKKPGTNDPALVALRSDTLAPAGGGQPHNNMMPYLTLNFCIAMQGIFPPRQD